MSKTKLEAIGPSHPYFFKSVVVVSITLKSVQHMKVQLHKVKSLSLSFISGILIAFFSIAGCSDMPYTGSMMATDDMVDQYIVSPNEELVCLQNDTDSACLTLTPKESKKADSINGPIIHIHPEKLVYMFYHEGKEIVRAEKIMDTTEIVETLTETKEYPAPQTEVPSGDIVASDADDTQQPDPLPQISNPPSDNTQPPPPPQDTPNDNTQPPPPPQPRTQPGGNVGDDPNDNDNPDDTPPPPQDTPSDNTPPPQDPPSDSTPPPPPTLLRINDPPSDNTPPPPTPPPLQDTPSGSTPPPPTQPLQTNNLLLSDDEPETVRHPTPDAMYSDPDSGWHVTIYYPENYKVEPSTDDLGFTITSSNETVGAIELRNTSCWLPHTPCNNGRTYSARTLITAGTETLYVNVEWDRSEDRWNGDPPSQRSLLQARLGGTHRIVIDMK